VVAAAQPPKGGRVIELRSHAEIPSSAARAEWELLLDEDPHASIFHGPRFLSLWHRVFESGTPIRVHTIHRDGRLLRFEGIREMSVICSLAKSGEHRVFATNAHEHKITTANYPLFDSRGRLYLTDSGNWMKRNGFLLRFDLNGRGKVLAGPLGYANGLALSADKRHLF
jgi:hypothetical protein